MAAPMNLTNLVQRPDVGNLGRPVQVRANFFRVLQLPEGQVYHYDTQVDPFLPQQKMIALWRIFEDAHPEVVHNAKSIFDGRRNVFSIAQFALGEDQAQSFPVDVANQPGFGPPGKENVFTIRLRLVNTIDMQELTTFTNAQSPCTPNCLTAIMLLDILLRYMPSQTHFTFNRSIFDATDRVPLTNGAEVWHGYYQSVRPAQGNMSVNIDMSATAMFESGPLPDIAAKILGKSSLNQLRMGISASDMGLLTRLLRGRTIQVVHRGERRIRYKITNLARPANQVAFAGPDGNPMLVSDYFLRTYNLRLNYPFLPCVVVRKDTLLPMEVCEIVPGQRFTRRLNPRQTAEFIKATAKPPQDRFNKIIQGLNILQHRNNPYLQEFGLNVSQEMEIVNARILQPPRIAFGQSTTLPQPNGWNLHGKKFKEPAPPLASWCLVNFAGAIPFPAVQRFIREMIVTFADLGMAVTNRNPSTLNADPQGDTERTLKEAWLRAGQQARAEPQLVVCILPNLGSQLYGEIKRITDTVIGVPSQCLQSKHVASAKKQYLANVALKVNVKLGGSNHTLNNGEIPFVSEQPTIVFGIDVSHPFPGSNAPSIAAVTASMDVNAVRYASTIRLQARTEIVNDLTNVVVELLRKFYQKTGFKPQRMIFYRDGVADSQFQQVMTTEVNAIRQAFALLGNGNYQPTITFVVVQKRHRARFLPLVANSADRSGNCLPGLVVDTQIVHPFEFDFYLQAHAAIKGTARTAHYHVLFDENNFNANTLQALTHKLCHAYARSTGPVSLVPAVYYADLVAARARLHRAGGDWSSDTSIMAGDLGDMQIQMAAALAEETLQLIFTHINTTKHLAQCRLVCKRFNAIAEKAMFNCPVAVNTESQALSLLQHLARCQRKGLANFHWGIKPTSSSTPQVLQHLLPMILTSKTVSITGIVRELEIFDLMDDIVNQLPEKPRLTAMLQPAETRESYYPYLERYKDTLQSARLNIVDSDYVETDHILDILDFPALRSVFIKLDTIDLMDVVRCIPDQLEELELEYDEVVIDQPGFMEYTMPSKQATIDWLRSNNILRKCRKMKKLTLRGDCPASYLEALVCMFPKLESVSIDMCFPDWLTRIQLKIRMDRIMDCLEGVAQKELTITSGNAHLLKEIVDYLKGKNFDISIDSVHDSLDVRMIVGGLT
ncbi:hypothetical protein MBANPS3_002436 [Mucor bainieri]